MKKPTNNKIKHKEMAGGNGGRGEIQINGVNSTYEEAGRLNLLVESSKKQVRTRK